MKIKKFRFKKVKSTNNTAIRIIKNSNFKKGMVVSETQLSGKGQHGKKWISYKGNLFVSFFHELKNINLSVPAITKINCLLVKKVIGNYYKNTGLGFAAVGGIYFVVFLIYMIFINSRILYNFRRCW